jgi:hypothetical protein
MILVEALGVLLRQGTEASHIHIIFQIGQFDFAGDSIRTHSCDKLLVRLMVAMR